MVTTRSLCTYHYLLVYVKMNTHEYCLTVKLYELCSVFLHSSGRNNYNQCSWIWDHYFHRIFNSTMSSQIVWPRLMDEWCCTVAIVSVFNRWCKIALYICWSGVYFDFLLIVYLLFTSSYNCYILSSYCKVNVIM